MSAAVNCAFHRVTVLSIIRAVYQRPFGVFPISTHLVTTLTTHTFTNRKYFSTNSIMPVPQGINGLYDFRKINPEYIEKETDVLISKQRAVYDTVGSLPLDHVSYENVIKQLADLMAERSTMGSPLDFPQHAATDKVVRDASSKAEQKLEEFDVEMSMRKEIFDRVVAFRDTVGLGGLTDEQKRLVDKLILHGKRNAGVSASKKSRKTLTLEQKLQVLERINKGQKTSGIVDTLKLSESTIRMMWSNAEKIRASSKAGTPLTGSKSSYSRPVEMQLMEKMLATWIDHQNKTNVPVSYKLIHAKAKSIYDNLKVEEKKWFTASSGWFTNFRRYFGFHNLKMVGKAASADTEAAEEYPAVLKGIIEEGKYSFKQVFNLDETGLYWKKLCPQFVHDFKCFSVNENLAKANSKSLRLAQQLRFSEVGEEDIDELLQSRLEELSNEELLDIERERVEQLKEADGAAALYAPHEQPLRTLTATNLSECLELIRQAMTIIEENDPNIERSSTVSREVMNKMACYQLMLKEKRKKKKQQSILSFFHMRSESHEANTETDPDVHTPDTDSERKVESEAEI
ncbi:hypothetical protein Pcinc_016441 [Petrolisthes cinctipes]|uniref:HTH CENPB-type domain-containing protein n=1 Tax=Petrolisthes cinctipes TaxID=88211 RepID=A0AAE1FRC5_PETCI|nr:hypothetical protein Pcinc_016441 [Petrolisthes cinctipes]